MTLLAPDLEREVSTAPTGPRRLSPPRTTRRTALRLIAVGFVVASVYSLVSIGVNPLTLWFERDAIGNLLDRMWPVQLDNAGSVFGHAIDTFFMAFLGTMIAVGLALPIGWCAASNMVGNRLARGVARAVIVLTRAVPDLILAMIFVRVFSIGALAGILALAIHSVGMLGKLFADALEQVDAGPREGVAATGASRWQELMSGVVPQVVPSFIATSLYRLDINFRSATLLGIVGAGGIGLDIKVAQGGLNYPQLLGVTLVVIAMIVVFEIVSTAVRSVILGPAVNARRGWWARLTGRTTVTGSRTTVAVVSPLPIAHRSLVQPWSRERVTMYVFGIACAVLTALSFVVTDVSLFEFLGGVAELPSMFWNLVPKSFDWWDDRFIGDFTETIMMGFAATAIALVFALPTGLLAARNVAPARWVYGAARCFILMVRALPDLIVAVVFVAALGLGPKPGVLALSIGLYAFAAKLFADAIEEVVEGPRDGVRATGATGMQESFSGVMTQAMPSIVGHSLYLLDVSIRSSTVLGIVGAGGIGYSLIGGARLLKWDMIGGLLIILFVIVYAIELLAGWVRKQII